MTTPAASPTQKSVQLSSISVTVRGQQKPKDLSVKVELSDVRIGEQKFEDKSLSKIQFNPPCSISHKSTLTVRLCKSHLFREEVLWNSPWIWLKECWDSGQKLTITLSFRTPWQTFGFVSARKPQNSNSAEDLIRSGVEVADNLKGILDYLGKNCKLINTLLSFGTAASEVRSSQPYELDNQLNMQLNPIAKAVLASVNEINKKMIATKISDLVMKMADCLRCVADVRQFARSEELLNALEQIDPLLRDTANFISQYSSFSAADAWIRVCS
ncbi:hypothetical protein C8J57DRAFT_1720660 [Mycena rebaudengoi]|nr:hypothetical protein C8J57DRAFT_1720660 [Mycena rebaudengoi]